MSDVQWNPEDSTFSAPAYRAATKTPKMVQWMMKTGWVKDEAQANYALVGLSVVFFIATIVIVLNMTGFWVKKSGVTYREDLTPEEQANIPSQILNQFPSRAK